MAIETKYKKEIERLANETGFGIEDIEKQVEEIKEKGDYDMESALAVWKSENSMSLGGTTENVSMRILCKTEAQHREGDRGEYDALWVYAFSSVDAFQEKEKVTDMILYELPLYNERIDMGDKLECGKIYDVKGKLVEAREGGLPRLRIIGDITPSNKKFPEIDELISGMGIQPISAIENFIGTTGFFSGKIGKVFDTKTGIGYEISAVGANPVAVFYNGTINKEFKVGDTLTAFGYVSQKDNIQISARGVF